MKKDRKQSPIFPNLIILFLWYRCQCDLNLQLSKVMASSHLIAFVRFHHSEGTIWRVWKWSSWLPRFQEDKPKYISQSLRLTFLARKGSSAGLRARSSWCDGPYSKAERSRTASPVLVLLVLSKDIFMTSKVVSTHKVVRDNPVSIVDLHKGKSQKGQRRAREGWHWVDSLRSFHMCTLLQSGITWMFKLGAPLRKSSTSESHTGSRVRRFVRVLCKDSPSWCA